MEVKGFSEDARITMMDGSYKHMKELRVGDVLKGGVKVTSVSHDIKGVTRADILYTITTSGNGIIYVSDACYNVPSSEDAYDVNNQLPGSPYIFTCEQMRKMAQTTAAVSQSSYVFKGYDYGDAPHMLMCCGSGGLAEQTEMYEHLLGLLKDKTKEQMNDIGCYAMYVLLDSGSPSDIATMSFVDGFLNEYGGCVKGDTVPSATFKEVCDELKVRKHELAMKDEAYREKFGNDHDLMLQLGLLPMSSTPMTISNMHM